MFFLFFIHKMKVVISISLLFFLADLVLPSPHARIVGGSDAVLGEFPYMGSVQILVGSQYVHLCGCLLYAPNRALTAAHCLTNVVGSYRVVFGMLAISDGNAQTSELESYVTHPGYNGNLDGFPNDIAVMKLRTPMDVSSGNVATLPLATPGDSFPNQACNLTGWGRLSGGGAVSNTLQKIRLDAMTNTDCAGLWTGITGAAIYDIHICGNFFGANGCDGDNGGPLVCSGKAAGVMSWGLASCDGTKPTVFTRVSEFYDWIASA